MEYLVPKIPKKFIGRKKELQVLQSITQEQEATIVVIYGRRRIGKTTLLEYAYGSHHMLKFEGIEGEPKGRQIKQVIEQLAGYRQEPLLRHLQLENWTDVFQLLYESVKEGPCVLYFEEVQWLANYKTEFIAELKYVWDNFFRKNDQLILVLCGSSPSFMINNVIHSKSLYNRSQYELSLQEFNIRETQQFLGERSIKETMNAYLTIGGVPEYLKWADKDSSTFLSICKNAFVKNGFFVQECEKIFTSSMATNPYYKKVIQFLSKKRFATRKEIAAFLEVETGGSLTKLLKDLELCGFIESYTPYNMSDDSYLIRYCIADHYLQFYFHFIKPKLKAIKNAEFIDSPTSGVNQASYITWLGYAFERFCRKRSSLIAKILGFSAVQYKSGVYFNRSVEKEVPGFQIDLVFDRADKVMTVCEIKYTEAKVTSSVIEEFERKLACFPALKQKTVHKILVTASGATEELINRWYFDQIITLEDLFKAESLG